MAVIISDNNEGPVANIAAWFALTVMILSVFTRLGSKYSVVRKWTADDTLITVTMVRMLLFGEPGGYCINVLVKDPRRCIRNYYLNDGRKRFG
jgi:hypothetical protein